MQLAISVVSGFRSHQHPTMQGPEFTVSFKCLEEKLNPRASPISCQCKRCWKFLQQALQKYTVCQDESLVQYNLLLRSKAKYALAKQPYCIYTLAEQPYCIYALAKQPFRIYQYVKCMVYAEKRPLNIHLESNNFEAHLINCYVKKHAAMNCSQVIYLLLYWKYRKLSNYGTESDSQLNMIFSVLGTWCLFCWSCKMACLASGVALSNLDMNWKSSLDIIWPLKLQK